MGGCEAMRIFIFARHGESTLNAVQVVNGDPHRYVPLTTRGECQARQLGEQLRNVELDVAFCTRFPRARQTAELALVGRRVPLLVEPRLDDIKVGALDGASIRDYRTWKRRHQRNQPFPGGESLYDAARRFAGALMSLLDRPEQRFLVVCHEVGIRSMLEAIDGAGWRRVPNAVPYLFDENAVRTAAHRLAMYGELLRAS
jgi:broad specificity phosphatase PhoE